MTAKWEEDYRHHDAWTVAMQIQEILEAYSGETEEEKATLVEVRTFNKAILSLREKPSIFVSDSALTDLRNSLRDYVLQNVQYWVNSNNVGHLQEALSGGEQVRIALRGWPIAPGTSLTSAAAAVRESAKASQEAVADLSRTTQRLENELIESVEEVRTKLKEQQETSNLMLQSSLTATGEEVQALDTSVTAIEGRITKTDSEVTRLDRKITTTIDGWQDQFTNVETSRANTHNDLVKEHRDDLKSVLDQASTVLEAKKAELDDEANVILTFLEQMRSEAADLVGNIAAASTSKHYNDYANNEKMCALLHKIGAALALVVTGGIALCVFHESNGFQNASTSTVLIKLGLGLPFAALATYLIKEAGKHTRQEMIARDLQLKMLALQPLISKVDEDKQKELLATSAYELLVADRRLGGEPLSHVDKK